MAIRTLEELEKESVEAEEKEKTEETPEELEVPETETEQEGEFSPELQAVAQQERQREIEEALATSDELQAVAQQERQREIEEALATSDAYAYGENIKALREAGWEEEENIETVFNNLEHLRPFRPYLEKLGDQARKEVARELVEFELKTTLFDKFLQEATEAGLGEKETAECLEKVKNGFRELILTGKLTSEDLKMAAGGGVHYVKELKSRLTHEPVGGAIAVFDKDRRAMIVSEALFQKIPDDGSNDKKRIIYHEVAHSLERALLPGGLPKEGQEEIEKILDQPELYQYLEGSYLSRELGALVKKIEAFHQEEPGSEKYKKLETEIREKKDVLREELLTERIATYLESDGVPESYLVMRARRSKPENIEKFKATGGIDPFQGELETIYPLLHRAFEDKAGWRERLAEEKFGEWQYEEYYEEDEIDFYEPLPEQSIMNKQDLREKGIEPKKEGPLTTLFRLFNQIFGNKKELPPKMAKKGPLG